MTETMGTSVTGTGSGTGSSGGDTRDTAKDEARGVAQDAAAGARSTAGTAKDQAQQVAGEAAGQARLLAEQARQELTSQGSAQKERATSGLRQVADDLSSMAEGDGRSHGIAGDIAREAAQRVRTAADWLESREPGDVLTEVRGFARRRPGVFLLSAAAAGFIGGRLTRGLADEVKDYAEAEQRGTAQGTRTAPAPAAPLSAGTGTGIGSTDPYATGVSDADPVRAATTGEGFPEQAPGTPGYSVPPTSQGERGDSTTQYVGDVEPTDTPGERRLP